MRKRIESAFLNESLLGMGKHCDKNKYHRAQIVDKAINAK